MRRNTNLMLTIDSGQSLLPFELQPIMRLEDNHVYAHEILYRGERLPGGWGDVDKAVLDYFRSEARGSTPTFINLDHSYLLNEPDHHLLEVSKMNSVYFEISEEFVSSEVFDTLSRKINKLSALGITFAIDDFGSGLDGLSRLFALDRVECIKVDGKLFQQAALRQHARESLSNMVAHWNSAGMITIAEWVESKELLEFAREIGFTMVQGFEVDALIASRNNASAPVGAVA